MAFKSHDRQKTTLGSAAAPIQNVIKSRPFAPPVQPDPSRTMADVQAQLEHARRYGHSLAKMNLAPRSSDPPMIQPKLTIGAPGDKYEQEADCMAQLVVQQLNASQNTHSEQAIQRETLAEEEDELQMKSMVQRSPDSAMLASEDLESAIFKARGSGQPLADKIRQPMEQAFRNDFSGVRIHTDAQSDRLNRSIQARAFTTGQDVFFRQGAYQPENQDGQELLAHELTHVVQQSNAKILRSTLNMPKIHVQARLVDVTTFENLKDQAANRKSLNRKHSSKDYKKLYIKYNTAFQARKINEAFNVLQEIDSKIGRMALKTYWKNNNARDGFLLQIRNGVQDERLILDKLSIERNVGEAFEESGSFAPNQSKNASPLSEISVPYQQSKQRHDMVVEVLKTIREQVPAARNQIMNSQLIATLDQQLPTPTTYVDIYNQISQLTQALAPTTRVQMIQQINNNLALNQQERVVEVVKVLWGDFSWQTEGDNDFRTWAKGQNNNARGPNATMNCWEVVLEVLLQAGVINQNSIRQTYTNRANMGEIAYYNSLRNLLGWNNAQNHLAYSQGNYTVNLPPAGSVIFYESSRPPDLMGNTLEHVVISLGQTQNGETQVMSLWNKETGGKLGKTTMDSLLGQSIEYISFS
jgi:Domain of unknown function (DUF4157)